MKILRTLFYILCAVTLLALISCGGGGDGLVVNVNVNVARPSIVTQPVSVDIYDTQTASFSVTATGVGTLTYQWRKNGVAIAGANASTLQLNNVTLADNGAIIEVAVTNAGGTTYSTSVYLSVKAAVPIVATVPITPVATLGQATTLSVAPEGLGPFKYQWMRDGVVISGANSATLVVTVSAKDNGAKYSVIVTNRNGSTTAEVATFSVVGVPLIVASPESATVFATQSVTFSVQATMKGTGSLTYQWRRNGMNLVAGGNGPSYTLNPAQVVDNNARYSVVVSGPSGQVVSSEAVLTVFRLPNIFSQPQTLTVYETQDAAFSVGVESDTPVTYQWVKNGVNIPGAASPTFTLKRAALTDDFAQIGVVISSLGWSSASTQATLTVKPAALSFVRQPVSTSITVGKSATFSVTPEGLPPYTYQWVRDGNTIAGATASTYTTPTLTFDDSGKRYSVIVTNGLGQRLTSAEAVLTVISTFNGATSCLFPNTSVSNDPLLAYQWHIKNQNLYFASTTPAQNTGIDLCLGGLWTSGITGSGVKVNVVDTGLEIAHEDLTRQIVPGGSYNFLTRTFDPTNSSTTGDHGTSVAGLIASTKGNGVGGSGIAPGAQLQGYNFLLSQSLDSFSTSFGSNVNYGAASADVFNYSAGSTTEYLQTVDVWTDSVMENLTRLRAGKGAIMVKSAGNGFYQLSDFSPGDTSYCLASGVTCQTISQDPNNTMYNVMVVASINPDGSKSSYSTTGSALWVSGFGGEFGFDQAVAPGYVSSAYKPAMLTTDQSSCGSGYVRYGRNFNQLNKGDGSGVSNANCNYTATFNGTSSAAPTVSGVVALMLQANPALTWRDVRHILAVTSVKVSPNQLPITNRTYFGTSFDLEQGWVLNAGGFWYHNWYGFGLVNAAAAVEMARSYTAGSLGPFLKETVQVDPGSVSIPMGNPGLVETFTMRGFAPTVVEQAELGLYFDFGFEPICTQIELISPSGTKSILLNMDSAHTSAEYGGEVRFRSNAFYGEPAAGTWTLRFLNSCSAAQPLSGIGPHRLTIMGR